jgi:hypothetical protein
MIELTTNEDKQGGLRRVVVSGDFTSLEIAVEMKTDVALGDEPVRLEVRPGVVIDNGALADSLVALAARLNQHRGGGSL